MKNVDDYEKNKIALSCELQFQSQSVYSDAVGVKTPESVFKGLLYSKDNRFLSEEFLLNFRMGSKHLGFGLGIGNYRNPIVVLNNSRKDLAESEDNNRVIALPTPEKSKKKFTDVMRTRRSLRMYNDKPMELKVFSSILYQAFGVTGISDIGPSLQFKETIIENRAYASAGALYPIDLYLLVFNVRGLQSGIYKYQFSTHSLYNTGLKLGAQELGDYCEFGTIPFQNANFGVAYVYRYFKNTRKYGESGLAFAFIEAGSMSQNLSLASESLDAGSCDYGGYNKVKFENTLGLDGTLEHFIHFSLVGRA